jgi:hypothetical protein
MDSAALAVVPRHGLRSVLSAIGRLTVDAFLHPCSPSLFVMVEGRVRPAIPGQDFSGLTLDRMNFSKLDLTRVNFRDSSLRGANFRGAKLRHANFTQASLEGADLRDSLLDEALFTGADLQNVRVERSTLCNARDVCLVSELPLVVTVEVSHSSKRPCSFDVRHPMWPIEPE